MQRTAAVVIAGSSRPTGFGKPTNSIPAGLGSLRPLVRPLVMSKLTPRKGDHICVAAPTAAEPAAATQPEGNS